MSKHRSRSCGCTLSVQPPSTSHSRVRPVKSSQALLKKVKSLSAPETRSARGREISRRLCAEVHDGGHRASPVGALVRRQSVTGRTAKSPVRNVCGWFRRANVRHHYRPRGSCCWHQLCRNGCGTAREDDDAIAGAAMEFCDLARLRLERPGADDFSMTPRGVSH